eukprot:3077867-Prymnesium_polylepis.1
MAKEWAARSGSRSWTAWYGQTALVHSCGSRVHHVLDVSWLPDALRRMHGRERRDDSVVRPLRKCAPKRRGVHRLRSTVTCSHEPLHISLPLVS